MSKTTKTNRYSFLPESKFVGDKIYLLVLIIVFELFLVFISNSMLAGEDDLFWYLSTGRYIVQTGNVPSADVFGFTTSGIDWIPFEWGWDIINYMLFSIGGYFALSVISTLIVLLVYYLIFYNLINLNVIHVLIFLFMLILTFGICSRLSIKPHLISYLSLILLLTIVIKYRYLDRSGHKILYTIPVIFLLWVNLHMGVINGFLLFGLFVLSELFHGLFSNYFSSGVIRSLSVKGLMRLAIILAAAVLITLVNPHGFKTYQYALHVVSLKQLDMIYEWQSPFSELYLLNFSNFVYYFYILGLVPVVYYSIKKKDVFPALLCVGFFINSLNAARLAIDFMLVSTVFLAVSVNYIIGSLKNKKISRFLRTHPAPVVILTVIVIFLVVMIPGNHVYRSLGIQRTFGTGIDQSNFPVKMFRFIRENKVDSIGLRPFNTYETGGFFIWNFPESKNFIGSRSMSDDLWNDYTDIINLSPGFRQKIDSLGFDYFTWSVPMLDYSQNPALLDQGILSFLFNEQQEWKLVYWDDISFLFLKNDPKYTALLSESEFKYFTPYNFYFHQETIERAFDEDRQTVVKEIERKQKEDPSGMFNRTMVKYYLSKIGKNNSG